MFLFHSDRNGPAHPLEGLGVFGPRRCSGPNLPVVLVFLAGKGARPGVSNFFSVGEVGLDLFGGSPFQMPALLEMWQLNHKFCRSNQDPVGVGKDPS